MDSVIREIGTQVDNGLKQIFVNTKVNDGSEISELMKCFESQKWIIRNFRIYQNG